jgi:hypothetical protein
MARLEATHDRQRVPRAMLVPEIHDVQLIVRLVADQQPAFARVDDLPQPALAIARRQEQQPAEHLQDARTDVRGIDGSSASARSSDSLMRLPSRAADNRCSRRTRNWTRVPYAAPR